MSQTLSPNELQAAGRTWTVVIAQGDDDDGPRGPGDITQETTQPQPPSGETGGGASWAVVAASVFLVLVAAVALGAVLRARRTRTSATNGASASTSISPIATRSTSSSSAHESLPGQSPSRDAEVGSRGPRSEVGVFISYRRDDAPHPAGRLADRMRERFGEHRIFMDVDSIEPGLDFGDVIRAAVQSCKVMLVVIGPKWNLRSDDDSYRIDNPEDYVRIEVEHGLHSGARVIPVLFDGAAMPQSSDLPESVKGLARRNAVQVTHHAFDADADRLADLIEGLLSTSS